MRSSLTSSATFDDLSESTIRVRSDSLALHSCRNLRLPAGVRETVRARESLGCVLRSISPCFSSNTNMARTVLGSDDMRRASSRCVRASPRESVASITNWSAVTPCATNTASSVGAWPGKPSARPSAIRHFPSSKPRDFSNNRQTCVHARIGQSTGGPFQKQVFQVFNVFQFFVGSPDQKCGT